MLLLLGSMSSLSCLLLLHTPGFHCRSHRLSCVCCCFLHSCALAHAAPLSLFHCLFAAALLPHALCLHWRLFHSHSHWIMDRTLDLLDSGSFAWIFLFAHMVVCVHTTFTFSARTDLGATISAGCLPRWNSFISPLPSSRLPRYGARLQVISFCVCVSRTPFPATHHLFSRLSFCLGAGDLHLHHSFRDRSLPAPHVLHCSCAFVLAFCLTTACTCTTLPLGTSGWVPA